MDRHSDSIGEHISEGFDLVLTDPPVNTRRVFNPPNSAPYGLRIDDTESVGDLWDAVLSKMGIQWCCVPLCNSRIGTKAFRSCPRR